MKPDRTDRTIGWHAVPGEDPREKEREAYEKPDKRICRVTLDIPRLDHLRAMAAASRAEVNDELVMVTALSLGLTLLEGPLGPELLDALGLRRFFHRGE
jgi:hypothetical protein